jgi:hypothetical protein
MIRVTGVMMFALAAVHAPATRAQQGNQKTFPSGEAAAEALFGAVQAHDEEALSQILGAGEEILSAGDQDEDDLDRQTFLEKYRQMHRLAREPDGTVLYLGAENWPFPIPLVSTKGVWSFDARTGAREILFRRIGANESFAIDVCRALARSEQQDPDTFVGSATPFHGYYFRALPVRGKPAAFIAYPAEYRSSGVMTFIVDREGVVYERDLGPSTAKVVSTLKSQKPDSKWQAINK